MSEPDRKARPGSGGYARNADIDALLRRLREHLDTQQEAEADVPLHQRGFGVMDEPPA